MSEFLKYGKIDTLFERNETTFKVIEGKFRRPEFQVIKSWDVTEKVDGTNVRAHWVPYGIGEIPGVVRFGGRTDNAQMPLFLVDYLVNTLTPAAFVHAFPDGDAQVTLYGEGYGGKIQKGGNYRKDASFCLFDVLVHGCGKHPRIWLEPLDVQDVAGKLGIACVPGLGRAVIGEIVSLVRDGMYSRVAARDSSNLEYRAEGVVARAPRGLLDRLGRRVMWKLKTKDFAPEKLA